MFATRTVYGGIESRASPAYVDSPAAVSRALARTGAGTGRAEGLARALAARAVRLDRLRGRLPNLVHVVPGPGPTLRDELARRIDRPVRLWATAGPVRPNRKPVAHGCW